MKLKSMTPHKGFNMYQPKKDEFKIAQAITHEPPGIYVPEPHPFVDRMEENKKILSLWTPNKIEGSRK